jgi:GNAT superfamily N-acetyltransferase
MPDSTQASLPVTIRLISESDSLRALTDMLHRAYKRHKTIGLEPVAANQPEEVTRRRIAAGECYVAELAAPDARNDNGGRPHVDPRVGAPRHHRVVGTILFRPPAPAPAPGEPAAAAAGPPWLARPDVAHFAQFAVDPDHQGRGIGRLLMETAEQRAAEIGAAEIALSTPEPAAWLVAMYERHGYAIVERWHWAETNYISAIMSKRL